MIDQVRFDKTKEEAEKFYYSIKNARCPYFKEVVNFNVKGLDHLKFKDWNKARIIDDQYRRFKLIKLAPEVIKLSNTLQGFTLVNKLERRKINSRWEHAMIVVKYYEFVAILNDVRVKVIVKQISGGEKYFWSIYPFWRAGKNDSKRLLFSGNPEIN